MKELRELKSQSDVTEVNKNKLKFQFISLSFPVDSNTGVVAGDSDTS